jgi:hypothetical protein
MGFENDDEDADVVQKYQICAQKSPGRNKNKIASQSE